MKDKKKTITIVISTIILIILVAGITYAALNWQSGRINLNLTSGCFDILYDTGQDIKGQLNPASSYTEGISATVKANIKQECTTTGTGTLYLETLSSTSSNLLDADRAGLLNYQVVKDDTATILSGSITSVGKIALDIGELTKASTATTTYSIYIWIDKELLENDDYNAKYYGKINLVANQTEN